MRASVVYRSELGPAPASSLGQRAAPRGRQVAPGDAYYRLPRPQARKAAGPGALGHDQCRGSRRMANADQLREPRLLGRETELLDGGKGVRCEQFPTIRAVG